MDKLNKNIKTILLITLAAILFVILMPVLVWVFLFLLVFLLIGYIYFKLKYKNVFKKEEDSTNKLNGKVIKEAEYIEKN